MKSFLHPGLCLIFFSFQVTCILAQPANDDCANAISITPQSWNTGCNYNVIASTQNATPSAFGPSCAGLGINDDIWYSFTATAGSMVIRFSEGSLIPSGSTGLALALYKASCPSDNSAFYCNNGFGFNSGHVIINGLTVGEKMYLRCWSPGNTTFMQFKLCLQDLPPAPVNDECSGATALSVQPFGQTCTNAISVSTLGATSSGTPAAACGGAETNDDVWLKFTATSAQHIFRFANQVQLLGSTSNLGMTIYDGGPSASAVCPSATTNIFCTGGFGFFNGFQLIGGFTPGNTYFIRVWSGGQQNFTSFDFCVQEVPLPPANDDCAGATSLSVQPFGQTCTSAVSVNTAGATASPVPAASCGGAETNDDVWMKFTATSAQHIFRFANQVQLLGSTSNLGMTIYDGGPSASAVCPSATTNIFCTGGFGFFNGFQLIGGFTPGNTYFIRVWSGGGQNFSSFDFCVQEVPPPPANDDCAGAISLLVQPFGQTCTNSVSLVTAGATASSAPAASCGGAETNDDVWMKFTATSAQHIFRFTNQVQLLGSTSNLGMTIYDGGPSASAVCPSATTNIFCTGGFGFFNGYQLIGGFTPGNTYFIRVWSGGGQNFSSFDFCVQEVPPPPANDDCTGAISLSVQPFGQTCTSAVSINTAGATASPAPAASCGGAETNDDVWMKFTATSAQHIFRFTNQVQLLGSTSNLGMTIYDGGPSASAVCPSATNNIFCTGGFGFFNGYQLIGGFIPGNTYFIRVWSGGGQNFSSFDFCVQEVPPPPANDNCSGATDLTVQPFGQTCTHAISVVTAGATASSVPAASCGGAETNDDVWLKFTATSTQHIFRFAGQVQLLGSTSNLGMTLYDGGPSASAVCPSATNNIFCTGGFGFFNGYQLIGGFIPGNTYFIRVWSGGGQNFSSFDFCVQEVPPPPANDECTGAIPISLQTSALTCETPINVNTSGATQSANKPECQGSNTEEDVWYSFTSLSTKIRIIYSDYTQLLGSSNNVGYALYKQSCPSGSASFLCSNNFGFLGGKTILEGFEPGATYYLRIWAPGNSNFSSFKMCLQAVIPPPNDECATAISLQTGAGFCTQPAVINLFDATTSQGFNSAPICRGAARTEDAWYTAIIPPTGNLVVQTSPANTTVNDLVMVAYTGNCNALAQIDCNDNGNPEPAPATNHPRLVFSGRTPGEKITFRVVSVTEQGMGRFATCATDTTTAVLPAIAPEGNCQQDTILIADSLANGYRWIPVMDEQGRIIAEYYPNSNAADTLFTSLFVNNSGTIRKLDNKPYANRNLYLSNRAIPLNGRIRIYVRSQEIALLIGADSTVAGTSNLVLRSDTASCGQTVSNRANDYTTVWASYKTDFYAQTTAQKAGQFFMEGACGNEITWTGAQNNSWHNPANWNCGGVPWIYSNVIIPSGTTRYPVISQPVEIRSLKMNKNAQVQIQPGIPVILNSMEQ